jgi:hypothetical protein
MRIMKKTNSFKILTLFSILSLTALFFFGCALPGISGSSSGSNSKTTSNVTMSGNFEISVNPNGAINSSLIQKSIIASCRRKRRSEQAVFAFHVADRGHGCKPVTPGHLKRTECEKCGLDPFTT